MAASSRKPNLINLGLFDRLAPILILILLWHVLAWFIKISRGIDFPGPAETLLHLYGIVMGEVLFEKTIYTHLAHSLKRLILGYGLASTTGISIGLVMGYFRSARRHFYPLISIMQPIPSIAWIPIAIMLFGMGDFSTIFIIFMASVWPNVINTVAGAENVPENYIRLARMYRMHKTSIFKSIVIPYSVPNILSGLRISIANAWRSLVAAEMIAATGTGLGYVIIQSRWNLDYTSALACIVIIAVIGYTIERVLFHYIERVTMEKWGMPTT